MLVVSKDWTRSYGLSLMVSLVLDMCLEKGGVGGHLNGAFTCPNYPSSTTIHVPFTLLFIPFPPLIKLIIVINSLIKLKSITQIH